MTCPDAKHLFSEMYKSLVSDKSASQNQAEKFQKRNNIEKSLIARALEQ